MFVVSASSPFTCQIKKFIYWECYRYLVKFLDGAYLVLSFIQEALFYGVAAVSILFRDALLSLQRLHHQCLNGAYCLDSYLSESL